MAILIRTAYLVLAVVALAEAELQSCNNSSPTTHKELNSEKLEGSGVNLTFVLSARDLGGVLNPTVGVAASDDAAQHPSFFGASEGGKSGSPEWNKVFWFIWRKGTGQKWHFQVIDHSPRSQIRKLGSAQLSVDEYAEKEEAALTLTGGYDGKERTLNVTKTTPIRFKVSARSLPRHDEFGGRSDPYLKIFFRRGRNGPNTPLWTTNRINNSEDPDWPDMIQFDNCMIGADQYLYFEVRDHDRITRDDLIGEAIIPVDDFVNSDGCVVIPIHTSKGSNPTLVLNYLHW